MTRYCLRRLGLPVDLRLYLDVRTRANSLQTSSAHPRRCCGPPFYRDPRGAPGLTSCDVRRWKGGAQGAICLEPGGARAHVEARL